MSTFTETLQSKSVVLNTNVEEGLPQPEHFSIVTEDVDVNSIGEGDVVISASVFSADPYLRGRIKAASGMKPGSVMVGFIAGKVIASRNAKWVVGDLIGASLPFKTVQIVTEAALMATVSWKLTGFIDESNISYGIGVLGMPGATAYGGLIDVLRPNRGETIFISAASGAVGALVGMIAKTQYDCKVVGSCGGSAKCALATETFGFDHAIDYKRCANAEELVTALREVAPGGIDMYFENVGGMHFAAAMETLRAGGRVAVCGQIAEYNAAKPELCALNPMKMIYSCQRIEGFISLPWLAGARGHFLRDMHQWLTEGKLKVQETFFDGIEQWPIAFQSLFTGANVGKVVVRV